MTEPSFIVHVDPKQFIKQFVAEPDCRQNLIAEDVENFYPKPDEFDMFSDRVKNIGKDGQIRFLL